MSKTIHDDSCDCVVCLNDYLRGQVDEWQKRARQLSRELDDERRANAMLSEYKFAKDALINVAGIKQATARECIEKIRAAKSTRTFNAQRNALIREIEMEFGV